MNINQVAEKYGVKYYRTSIYETLFSLCLRIYGDYNEYGLLVLRRLNPLVNWNNVPVDTVIKYINAPKQEISEVW